MSQTPFIFGLDALQGFSGQNPEGCVLTIGSFDGLHLGHQHLIEQVRAEASRRQLPAVAMIFEPQPYEYFHPEECPARLMRLREKVASLLAAGIDKVVCLKFDTALRSLSAQAFIERILIKGLNVRHLQIGDDFRFGCDRAGDFALLQQAGREQGFSVAAAQTLSVGGQRVSSTRVRKLLEQSEFNLAQQLLGRAFSLTGRIGYGRQLGRTLQVPTANVMLGRKRAPVHGVFAVRAYLLEGSCLTGGSHLLEGSPLLEGSADLAWGNCSLINNDLVRSGSEVPGQVKRPEGLRAINGVANVGFKPTIHSKRQKPGLEVHLLDFDGQIYGRFMRVEFLKKLRDEQKFESFDDLKHQIFLDIEQSRQFFNANDKEANR